MNKIFHRLADLWSRLLRRLLSVPIYFKILGIGALVAVLFGGVNLYQIRNSMTHHLYETLEQRTFTLAASLSTRLENPLATNDLFTVHQALHKTAQTFKDVSYIIVHDQKGRVLAHTFEKNVPPDLLRLPPADIRPEGKLLILDSPDGLIFEATVPILSGHAGNLRIGINDKMIFEELSHVTRSILVSLALCMIIGEGLALVLTYILTRPIHHLVLATKRIQKGEFEYKAEVFAEDEIGKLAEAFNQMAEGLLAYRNEVQDKEAARLALIEKIVLAQEEERKRIARDLHDQLGQSLLAFLLTIQSAGNDKSCPPDLTLELETRTRKLIDEVRHLAWDIRPSILDDYGFDMALEQYIDEAGKRFDEVAFDYQSLSPPDLERLPARIEVTLYRIAQEAITNIVRHSHARQASVVLIRQNSEVTLLIEDDGVGFDYDSIQKDQNNCLGLLGIKERAALVGGDFAVESMSGNGTSIRIRIPINKEN